MQKYDHQTRQVFVDIINNDKRLDLYDWMQRHGRMVMRQLNNLTYSGKIPKILFNHNLDIDVLNEFVDMEIIDFLLKDMNFKNKYQITYKNITINLEIISQEKRIPFEMINRITNIIILMGLYKSKTELINLDITIYLTNFKKVLNLNSKVLGREINSGFNC